MTQTTETQITETQTAETQTTETQATEAYQATQYLLRRIIPPHLYYKLRTFNRQYPLLFLPFARWRWRKWRAKYCADITGVEPAAPQPLEKESQIVIEAYPRSGNTFAHVAFKYAQKTPVPIAHHTHAAANLIAGVRQQKPALVIIREPEDAVVSYLIGDFDPHLSMEQALREYISFYQPLVNYKSQLVVATFAELISDYGAIIKKVNLRFKTDFTAFEHTPENVEHCFELIDCGYEQTFGELSEKVVSRPAASRKVMKEQLLQEINSDRLKELVTRAKNTYTELVD